MKNKIIQNLPESYSKFVVKFKANIDRLNKTKETIFESTIDSSQITDAVLLEHYNYFVKNYLDEYNSNGRDQTIILKSIYESYNQSIFNSAIDAVPYFCGSNNCISTLHGITCKGVLLL